MRTFNRLRDTVHPNDAKLLARRLMNEHGLHGWSFRFDFARRRFGCCHYGPRAISLSRPLTVLNDESQVRDTLLHEIAHALTPGDGHGEKWRAACRKLGAAPVRCYTESAVRCPPRPPAPYVLGCRKCNWWVERRRLDRRGRHCTRCGGRVGFAIRQPAPA